jgi:hypothetical protein
MSSVSPDTVPILLIAGRRLPDRCCHQMTPAIAPKVPPTRPAVALGATTAKDAQVSVRFTAQRTMPVAILVPGHQVARSAEGAVLINVSE